MKIKNIQAIEILDSRGNPTIRTFVTLENNSEHVASVPSGASTGSKEAVELRDKDMTRYEGQDVLTAIHNVNTEIKNAVINKEADTQTIDQLLIDLDGTHNKARLGANAILSVSMAVARAAAHSQGVSLWQYLNQYYFYSSSEARSSSSAYSSSEARSSCSAYSSSETRSSHDVLTITPSFPRLMVNVINGGVHASWNFDFQEFMIVPNSTTPSESIRVASEIFHSLGTLLKEKGLSTLVGDEGGYSPTLPSNEDAFQIIIEAAKTAGHENIKDFRLAIDAAASEFYKDGAYMLKKESQKMTSDELSSYYSLITNNYSLLSIEDAFDQQDYNAHKKFTEMAEKFDFITIGDDLFCTNPKLIEKGIEENLANGVLIKLNQIGTVTETAKAINLAKNANWKVAVSHRSGETEDTFIADLAYACAADFLKAGSMSRSERLSKYNRLLEIECNL